MNGVERIAAERKQQLEEHGWDGDHDYCHTDESLALAACHYAIPENSSLWPDSWHLSCDKRGHRDRIRDLEKAGALIAAEIDRLLAIRLIAPDGKPLVEAQFPEK